MGFSFDKYNEIVNKIDRFNTVLKEAKEEDYMSFEVHNAIYKIIQEANRVNIYIRHHKDK